jgi:hypothetical protein
MVVIELIKKGKNHGTDEMTAVGMPGAVAIERSIHLNQKIR